MTILKLVLIGSLRIVFMGSLKVALLLCTLFFSLIRLLLAPFPTAMVMLATMLPTPRQKATMAISGKRDPLLSAARRPGFWGTPKDDVNVWNSASVPCCRQPHEQSLRACRVVSRAPPLRV